MTGITYLSPCPWTPLHNLASHLWVLISGLLSLMKRAVPKLSLTGPKGPPRNSAAGMAEGRLFCPKLSYFGLTQSKVRPYSRPHPLNAYPINVIEPHGVMIIINISQYSFIIWHKMLSLNKFCIRRSHIRKNLVHDKKRKSCSVTSRLFKPHVL